MKASLHQVAELIRFGLIFTGIGQWEDDSLAFWHWVFESGHREDDSLGSL